MPVPRRVNLSLIRTKLPSKKPDLRTREEIDDLERQSRKADIAAKVLDIKLRRKYAGRIYWLIVAWLVAVTGIVVMQAVGYKVGWQGLSDSVLITILTTTTVNVLGIFIIVVHYIFPKRDK